MFFIPNGKWEKKNERIEKLLLLESKEKTKEGDMEFIFLNEIYLNENERNLIWKSMQVRKLKIINFKNHLPLFGKSDYLGSN